MGEGNMSMETYLRTYIAKCPGKVVSLEVIARRSTDVPENTRAATLGLGAAPGADAAATAAQKAATPVRFGVDMYSMEEPSNSSRVRAFHHGLHVKIPHSAWMPQRAGKNVSGHVDRGLRRSTWM